MSALVVAISAPSLGDAASPFLSDEFMTAWERSARAPLEAWSEDVHRRLLLALERPRPDIVDYAFAFDAAARIAVELGALGDASRLRRASLRLLTTSREPRAFSLALSASLSLGLIERADGHYDDALYRFERLAALPLGGSFEEGPLVVTPALFASLARFAPSFPARLASVALAEALDTLIKSGRYELALAVAKIRDPRDPAWLDSVRREATATALSRMGLFREALVFLASAVAREPLATRPLFEQKRVETLAAAGQIEGAADRAAYVAETLSSRFREAPASLDELFLACRVCRSFSLLGQTDASASFAGAALPFAEALGDVPLAIELASRVAVGVAPRGVNERAERILASFPLSREAPSFSQLRDRLLSLAP